MAALPHAAPTDGFDDLLEAIYGRYQYDFRQYARVSLRRRVGQALAALSLESVEELHARVLEDPHFFSALLPYLTVQVSELFRDPSYFRALREHVVPVLRTYPSLRFWVAGCSTGEEAYALAVLLREEGLLGRSFIYATDINVDSLRVAETGVYAQERMPQFEHNHRASGAPGPLSDHVTCAYGAITFDRGLKSKILFSDHSLATDSVFTEVQLISCRNVLIYFDRALQDRAVGLFRDALCHRGFLGLGVKESLRFIGSGAAFSALLPEERIYQRY